MELLLEKGADARWTNNKDSTLLHFLVYSSMEDGDSQAIGRKLIKAGVNVDAKVSVARVGTKWFGYQYRVYRDCSREENARLAPDSCCLLPPCPEPPLGFPNTHPSVLGEAGIRISPASLYDVQYKNPGRGRAAP